MRPTPQKPTASTTPWSQRISPEQDRYNTAVDQLTRNILEYCQDSDNHKIALDEKDRQRPRIEFLLHVPDANHLRSAMQLITHLFHARRSHPDYGEYFRCAIKPAAESLGNGFFRFTVDLPRSMMGALETPVQIMQAVIPTLKTQSRIAIFGNAARSLN